MIIGIDAMLSFYMLFAERYHGQFADISMQKNEKVYKPYTTSYLMTNSDMYNIDDICEKAFIDQINDAEGVD